MRSYQDMFRPNYDAVAICGWISSIVLLTMFRPPLWWLMLPVSTIMVILRFRMTANLYRFWISINAILITVNPIALVLNKWHQAEAQKALWLGYGFRWEQRHAEIAHQIKNRVQAEMKSLPIWLEKALLAALQTPKSSRSLSQKFVAWVASQLYSDGAVMPTVDAIGMPWIHGLGEANEQDVFMPLSALTGHTLVLGTTRAGKTRLYELLTTQIIHANKCLIVIDPKKDRDLVKRLRKECKATGRKFLYFDLANPGKSIRINPLANFNNVNELATRISQLVDADGSFLSFAWDTLNQIQAAMVEAGEKPTIRSTRRYTILGVEPLAEKLLSMHFQKVHGPHWARDLPATGKPDKTTKIEPRLDAMMQKYVDEPTHTDAIDGLVSMVRHEKGHYSKMVQTLKPILAMLGSSEVGALLSPDPTDEEDQRPIYDIRKVIDENAVLYVGLDSLSNKTISSAVGSILLADMASTAGGIYNSDDTKDDVYLLIDEAAEVLNDQATQLLNKGGGAGFKIILAAQSIADFETCYKSKPKAEQALGNLNNLISLRVRSVATAEYVSHMFGETKAREIEVSHSTGTESSAAVTEFRGQTSRSLKSEKIQLVSPDLLLALPPMHYFAFLAGATKWKGRLPIIKG